MIGILKFFAFSFNVSQAKGCKHIVNAQEANDVDVHVTTANKSMLFTSVPLNFNTKPNMATETTKPINFLKP
jgi:hypothetical protein